MRTGFARVRQGEHDVGCGRQRALCRRGNGNEADPETARIVDQVLELGRFSRPRQSHDHVVGRDHSEIAVAGFAGMNEKGGRAGRGKGRRNFARDVPRFAHAGDDQPSPCARYQLDRRDKIGAEPIADGRGERANAAGFRFQRAERRGDQVARTRRSFARQWLLHRSSFLRVVEFSTVEGATRPEPKRQRFGHWRATVNPLLTISILPLLTNARRGRGRCRGRLVGNLCKPLIL